MSHSIQQKYFFFLYLNFSSFFFFLKSYPIPGNKYETSLRNFNIMCPELFSDYLIDRTVLQPTHEHTQLISPKITQHCLYAYTENMLTNSDYKMPNDCGAIASITTHSDLLHKSSALVGTFSCTKNRGKCLPPLSRYNITSILGEKNNKGAFHATIDSIQYYDFTFFLDTASIKFIQILKDEQTSQYYWTTKYCLKYMTATIDFSIINIGPDVKYHDVGNQQFCIADYSSYCTPAGPFDTVKQLVLSLPIKMTLYSDSDLTTVLHLKQHTFDDSVKRSIAFDDHSRFDLDKKFSFMHIHSRVHLNKPDFICTNYHIAPISTIFHIDLIIDSLEKKILQYITSAADYIIVNFDNMLYSVISYFQKLFDIFIKFFLKYIFKLIFDCDLIGSIIILTIMSIYNNNYTSILITIMIYEILKYMIWRQG